MAVRCISPPESWWTKWPARGVMPTRSSNSSARGRVFAGGLAGEEQGEGHVLQDVHRRQEVEKLENDPEVLPAVAGQRGLVGGVQGEVADEEFPGGRAIQAAEEVQQGGFAAAARAGDGGELALGDFEGQGVQRADGRPGVEAARLGRGGAVSAGHVEQADQRGRGHGADYRADGKTPACKKRTGAPRLLAVRPVCYSDEGKFRRPWPALVPFRDGDKRRSRRLRGRAGRGCSARGRVLPLRRGWPRRYLHSPRRSA